MAAPGGRLIVLTGVVAGATFGVLYRVLAEYNWALGVMTIAFVVGVPVVMGVLTVRPIASVSILGRVFLPWATVLIAIVVTALLTLEGAICSAMALPLMLVGASAGGLIELAIRKLLERRVAQHLAVAGVLALPFLSAIEGRSTPPLERRTVDSRVTIDADAATVWRHVASVDEIRPDERYSSLIHWIGFPHPLAATLSHPGVGGVRHATFERGVLFIETITEWQPERALAFTFHAQTDQIPRTALDPHVTVGGEFFDVLEGRYDVLPLADGRCELRLSSRHRLSTRFNRYASLWSDFVMGEIQRTILAVIRDRCESDAAGAGDPVSRA